MHPECGIKEKVFSVFIVDDDSGVLKALSRLLRTSGYEVMPFNSPKAFLDQHDRTAPGCAIFDLAMPGLDGLQLQSMLLEQGVSRSVIFLSGQGDISVSVRAMKNGAVDFLTKPVDRDSLLDAVARAKAREEEAGRAREERHVAESRLSNLTPREREVLTHVVAGRLNKQIAGNLGIVEKTIKVHRGRMMEKMGVRTVAELVRLADKAGVEPFANPRVAGRALPLGSTRPALATTG
jgi:FixJ family two-component response regulator